MSIKFKQYFCRFLSVLLCISILCVFVISPVAATSIETLLPLDDVLALQERDTFWYYPNSNPYRISFSYSKEVCYSESIVRCNTKPVVYSAGYACQVIELSFGTYRIISNARYADDTVNFSFYSSDGSLLSYINFISCSVSSMDLTFSDLPYQVQGYSLNQSDFFESNVSPGSTFNLPAGHLYDNLHGGAFDFTIHISPSDYRSYDLIFVRFSLNNLSLNSVLPRIGDYIVPYDLTINNTTFDFNSFPYQDQSSFFQNNNHYGLTLDVSGLIKSDSSQHLNIHVSGTFNMWSKDVQYFGSIMYVTGYVKPPVIEVDVYWYKKLFNLIKSGFNNIASKLDNILTGRDEDQAAADSFNDSINDQSNELEDLTSDLNSVNRPPLSDVNLSTNGMVDQAVVLVATNGIGSILSNQIILRVLIMSLTFALSGFILFGKR